MQTATACREREILEGRARADLKVYVLATGALEDTMTKEEFEQAYENSERARSAFERSRDFLKAHIATHGCTEAD